MCEFFPLYFAQLLNYKPAPEDGIELVMIILGTLGQVISNDGPRVSIFGALLFWRFIVRILCFIPLGQKQV